MARGAYKWPPGEGIVQYVGEYKNDYMMHGHMKYNDGSVYTGDFLNHQSHGRGTLNFTNGSVYDGEWCNGKRHGRGKYTTKLGISFIGQMNEDKIGEGIYTDVNGEVLDGAAAVPNYFERVSVTYSYLLM